MEKKLQYFTLNLKIQVNRKQFFSLHGVAFAFGIYGEWEGIRSVLRRMGN